MKHSITVKDIMNKKYVKKKFNQVISESKNFDEVFKRLGLPQTPEHFETIMMCIERYEADISHFEKK